MLYNFLKIKENCLETKGDINEIDNSHNDKLQATFPLIENSLNSSKYIELFVENNLLKVNGIGSNFINKQEININNSFINTLTSNLDINNEEALSTNLEFNLEFSINNFNTKTYIISLCGNNKNFHLYIDNIDRKLYADINGEKIKILNKLFSINKVYVFKIKKEFEYIFLYLDEQLINSSWLKFDKVSKIALFSNFSTKSSCKLFYYNYFKKLSIYSNEVINFLQYYKKNFSLSFKCEIDFNKVKQQNRFIIMKGKKLFYNRNYERIFYLGETEEKNNFIRIETDKTNREIIINIKNSEIDVLIEKISINKDKGILSFLIAKEDNDIFIQMYDNKSRHMLYEKKILCGVGINYVNKMILNNRLINSFNIYNEVIKSIEKTKNGLRIYNNGDIYIKQLEEKDKEDNTKKLSYILNNDKINSYIEIREV